MEQPSGYRDDLISYLLQVETDTPSGRFEDEEILDICALLMFGGLDTTTAATAHAILHLAEDGALRSALVADPGLIPVAVEEFLRYEAPVQALPRTATRDTDLGGQHIKEGDRLWLLWASANLDPARFDRHDELVLDRHPNHHMSFGVGIHRCLGAHLGRAQVRIMLEELLRRMPEYSLVPDRSLERHASIAYGLRRLEVLFEPAARHGAAVLVNDIGGSEGGQGADTSVAERSPRRSSPQGARRSPTPRMSPTSRGPAPWSSSPSKSSAASTSWSTRPGSCAIG